MNIILNKNNISETKNKIFEIFKNINDKNLNIFLEEITIDELISVLHFTQQLYFKITIISVFSNDLFDFLKDTNFIVRCILFTKKSDIQKIEELPEILRNKILTVTLNDQ